MFLESSWVYSDVHPGWRATALCPVGRNQYRLQLWVQASWWRQNMHRLSKAGRGWRGQQGSTINEHFKPRKHSISNSHFSVFLVVATFSFRNLIPHLNALVICWPLNCEQGLTGLHANRIKKQLVLLTLNTIFYLICTLSCISAQTSVSPWESMLEINGWIKQASAFRLDHRHTPYSVSNQLLRHSVSDQLLRHWSLQKWGNENS